MKICFISNLYSPYLIGGAEKYIEELAKHLAKENEVVVVTTKPYEGLNSLKPSVEDQNGVKIYRFFPMNIYHTYYAKQITDIIKPIWHIIDLWNIHPYFVVKKILKKEKAEVVHTHNLGGLSLSIFSAIKSLKIPHVHTMHDYGLLCPNAMLFRDSGEICKNPRFTCKIYRKLKRKLANDKPDIVIVASQFVLNLLEDKGFFESTLKICLPYPTIISDNNNYKQRQSFNILYVGQLAKHKGVHILIKSFKKLNYTNIRLHIVGEGSYRAHLENEAKNDERIIFYGYLPNKEISKFYKMCDVTVVPSIWHEPFGLVIIESFSHGTPVIGSRVGGIPELVQDGYNGFLTEKGNEEELRERLDYIIKNTPKLKELIKNASFSATKYDVLSHVKRLQKIYESLINNSV